MIQEQVKTILRDSIIVIDTEVSIKRKTILENILSYIFKDEIEKYNISVSMNNVLYITDGLDNENIKVDFNGSQKEIETKSFIKFTKQTFNIDEFKSLFYSKSTIIVGCINRMDPNVINSILSMFSAHTVILYGDTSLSYQDEYKSFYSNLFTNTILDITENYTSETFDVNKKKIYNVISKIRKGVEPSKLSVSSIFNLLESNEMSSSEIASLIEDDNNAVVIPDIYYNKINSLVYYNKYSKSDLIPSMGMEYYNVYPLVVKDMKGEPTIIPPFTRILITAEPLGDLYYSENSIFIDVTISYNGKIYYSVPFDFGFFINNFSKDEHPEYSNEYDIINNVEQYFKIAPMSYTSIKPIPFKILKSIYVKQSKFKNIRVYELTIPPINIQSLVNNNLYSSICTATDSIEIVSSIDFNVD